MLCSSLKNPVAISYPLSHDIYLCFQICCPGCSAVRLKVSMRTMILNNSCQRFWTMLPWLRENYVSQNSFPSMNPRQNWPKEKNIDEIREKQHAYSLQVLERERQMQVQPVGWSFPQFGWRKMQSAVKFTLILTSPLCLMYNSPLGDQYHVVASDLQKVNIQIV